MDSMVEMMAKGGPTMYLVLLLLLTTSLVALIGAVLAVLHIRVPALGWLAVPIAALAVGVLGRLMGLFQLEKALAWASFEQRDALACSGMSIATLPETFALWGCAGLLAFTALVAGIGTAIGAGKETRWTLAPALVATGVGAVGWLGIAAWAAMTQAGVPVLAIPAVLLFGGMGITAAALRMGTAERDTLRTAAGRGLVAACTGLAVGCAVVAGRMGGASMVQEAVASADPESMASLMTVGLAQRIDATSVGLATLALVLVAGAIPALAAARSLFRPYTLVSGAATLLVLGLLGGLHGIGAYQQRSLEGGMSVMRAVEHAAMIDDLPSPPDTAGEARVTYLDRALRWDCGGWTRIVFGASTLETPSMEYAGDEQPLIAAPGSAPAQGLLRFDEWDWGREVTPSRIRVLTQRPAYDDRLHSPYLDWIRLGAVEFLWLPGGNTAPPPLDDTIGTEQKLDWPPIQESIYVLDGGNAPGAADLGLPADSTGIWVIAVGAAPREIPRGDDAARLLAEAVEVLDRPYVVFLPAGDWTVQDLVTLCLTAVPPGAPYDINWWTRFEVKKTCAIDTALPFPAHGPRLQGLR